MAQLCDLSSDDSAVMPNVAVPALPSVEPLNEVISEDKLPYGLVEQNFHYFINQQLASQLVPCQTSDAEPKAQLSAQLNALSPVSLAYIGDAVFELYVRSRLLLPAQRIRDYHNQVVNRVKAEQQSQYVDLLIPHLTDAEKDILRRGRNATSGRHRRAEAQSYQKATGFETLIGFLYLSDQIRLLTLLNQLTL